MKKLEDKDVVSAIIELNYPFKEETTKYGLNFWFSYPKETPYKDLEILFSEEEQRFYLYRDGEFRQSATIDFEGGSELMDYKELLTLWVGELTKRYIIL